MRLAQALEFTYNIAFTPSSIEGWIPCSIFL